MQIYDFTTHDQLQKKLINCVMVPKRMTTMSDKNKNQQIG